MKMDCQQLWSRCLQAIEERVPEQAFKTWFLPIKPISLKGRVLTIQVPTMFFYEYIEEHYVLLLSQCLTFFMGANSRLEYSIASDAPVSKPAAASAQTVISYNTSRTPQKKTAVAEVKSVSQNPFQPPVPQQKMRIDSRLESVYTFENFVVGDCNRLACSGGLAVAENPGTTSFNPLLLFGKPGMGKTHLAQAVGNRIKDTMPDKTVLYVQSEIFGQQFVEALKKGQLDEFTNFYRGMIDVLIIDDIQFFSGKIKMQEVFFSIFNEMHRSKKQIILTCDKPPKDLEGVEERLLSRFKWALSAGLDQPDIQTRKEIVRMRIKHDKVSLPEDVIDYVAYHIINNIRELEGVVTTLFAHASVSRGQIDLPAARLLLSNFIKQHVEELAEFSIEAIQQLVSEYFDVSIEALASTTRKRPVVQARQISMFLSKTLTNNSLKAIGKMYGGRDHSTVIHACKKVEDQMKTDKAFRGIMTDVQNKLNINGETAK